MAVRLSKEEKEFRKALMEKDPNAEKLLSKREWFFRQPHTRWRGIGGGLLTFGEYEPDKYPPFTLHVPERRWQIDYTRERKDGKQQKLFIPNFRLEFIETRVEEKTYILHGVAWPAGKKVAIDWFNVNRVVRVKKRWRGRVRSA